MGRPHLNIDKRYRRGGSIPVGPSGKMGFLMMGASQGGGVSRVLPASLAEVAELIECEAEDLTFLRYGAEGQCVMSRSRQLDRAIEPNRDAAMLICKLHQLPIYIRGAVVCFPHGFTWEEDRDSTLTRA